MTNTCSVAVAYLARGVNSDYIERFQQFAQSYRAHSAGMEHTLYVIFKGFSDESTRTSAEMTFDGLSFKAIDTDDTSFDLGAYADALHTITEEVVCFLNTNTEIASPNWVRKLVSNLCQPGVGMVGATGSYESLSHINRLFPAFPNPHLRSNAFALRRIHASEILGSYNFKDKLDAFFAESGPNGLTRRMLQMGLTCLIVGADGRGYTPQQWTESDSFRQGDQANLLIRDNQTRAYMEAGPVERMFMAVRTWGAAYAPRVVEV
ncbi:hypothetical protein MKK75_30640 [Methylobacterium sp. J-030]|uniref:hypothetical protein n=1 Tax=Methylobacterium sp. J-030 TaxID=2836627 RepID=UPI001FBB8D47|nr:hypothetical protein [Methylobacterium sp. J-030]MCJ2073095.1 hypothetical protein [Methylobacterium sp. J-030]